MKERIKGVLPSETIEFLKKHLKGNSKVSVIVPVYNVAPFLSKCIESICNQNYKQLEIILIDDGSTDESGAICEKFAACDHRIKVIHKENGGVSVARNLGLNISTGKYVCFVDGDDFVLPDYVGYMLALAIKYDAEISLTTQMFGNFDEKQVNEDKILEWTSEDAVEAILCYKVPIGCYCKLFKKEVLQDTRFMADIFIGEGFNFNITAFQKVKKIVAGNVKIYYYRRDNPTSAMTKFSIKKCECGLLALEIIKQNLIFTSNKIQVAWKYANWRTHSDFYDMLVLAKAQSNYPEIYRRCLDVTRKDALIALRVPTSKKNKIRAIIMWVCPCVIPWVMIIRKYKYHVNVNK